MFFSVWTSCGLLHNWQGCHKLGPQVFVTGVTCTTTHFFFFLSPRKKKWSKFVFTASIWPQPPRPTQGWWEIILTDLFMKKSNKIISSSRFMIFYSLYYIAINQNTSDIPIFATIATLLKEQFIQIIKPVFHLPPPRNF